MGVCGSVNKPSFLYEQERKKKEFKKTIEFNSQILEKTKSPSKFNKNKIHRRIKSTDKTNIIENDLEKEKENEKKFERKGKRSISLIQKNKIATSLFKEELKLKITTNS